MQKSRGVDAPAPADLFYPDLNVRAPRAPQSEIIPAARLASHLLKERRQYPARAARMAARRRFGRRHDARGDRGDRGRDDAAEPARVLVDGSCAARSAADRRARAQLRREAARRAHRHADSPRRPKAARRSRTGCVAKCSITSRRRNQARRRPRRCSARTTSAALIPTAEALDADVVRRQPLLRDARDQLASAKDAWLKAASGRSDTSAEAAAAARLSQCEGDGGQASRAVAADVGPRRAPGRHAGRRRFGAAGDGVRDGAAARRERVRELQQPVARIRRSKSRRC